MPWDFYFGLAVTEFGIPPSEFWRMTVQEVWLLVAFKNRAAIEERRPMDRGRFDELMRLDAQRNQHGQ